MSVSALLPLLVLVVLLVAWKVGAEVQLSFTWRLLIAVLFGLLIGLFGVGFHFAPQADGYALAGSVLLGFGLIALALSRRADC